MTTKRFTSVLIVIGACALTPPLADASRTGTVAPTAAQRTSILKAFGAPRRGWSCMRVRVAASNHRYATVRPLLTRKCRRYAFNGTNIIKRTSASHWKVLFEGSAYACPLAKIPRQVQRDLGVCK